MKTIKTVPEQTCKPNFVLPKRGTMTIHLGLQSPTTSSDLPALPGNCLQTGRLISANG